MKLESIGNIVRDKRKKLGLTQRYLAAYANTGVRFISDLENGKTTIQLDKLILVLEALNIEVEIKVWVKES